MQDIAANRDLARDAKPKKRLVGIDAARGLALIGLMAVHILPNEHADTGDPTVAFTLFYGDSAALFALLAGVGLALSSGGRTPHQGQQMKADRVGLVVRAAVIAVLALLVAAIIQPADPEDSILLYYSVFFLLAIPFLHLGPRTLFLSAVVFIIVAPIVMQQLGPVLPEWSESNPSIVELFAEPAGVASQLLLTGTYPALPYMAFILAGLGLGRLDLRSVSVQAWLAGIGAALAVLANAASALLINVAGGYEALLDAEGMSEDDLDEALIFGPDVLPDTSGWWLAIATPHTNTPLALASSLGMALLVLGVFLLIARMASRWMYPLYAMGAMTLTLYTVHLLALAFGVHEDLPVLWFIVHVLVAMGFAMAVFRRGGRGPLERVVTATVKRAKRLVKDETAARATAKPDHERRRSGLAAEDRESALND